jgi:hypothetical protein
MGFEVFLMGLVIGFFLSSYGYVTLGYVAIILSFVFMLFDFEVTHRKRPPSVKVKGAQMLEPIVIEVPKGPPYKIPKFTIMKVNPYWGGYPGYEHMTNAITRGMKYLYWNLTGRKGKM